MNGKQIEQKNHTGIIFRHHRRLIWLAVVVFLSGWVVFPGLVELASATDGGDQVFLPIVLSSVGSDTEPIPPTPAPTPIPDFTQQVIALVNVERLTHGCQPVAADSRLMEAAEGHSQDMAMNDFFSHTGSDGSTPWDRIRETNYWYSAAGETIAAGYTTPESVVAAWMASPAHREIILDCSYIHVGIGYYYLPSETGSTNYYHYWTQDFAAP